MRPLAQDSVLQCTSAIGLSKPRTDQVAPPSFLPLQHFIQVSAQTSGGVFLTSTPASLSVPPLLTTLVNTHLCFYVSVFSTETGWECCLRAQ